MRDSRPAKFKKYKKYIILGFVTFVSSLLFLVTKLVTTKYVALYPQLKGEFVDFYIKNDEQSISLINSALMNKKQKYHDFQIVIGRRKVTKTLPIDKLDFSQRDCKEKYSCPVMTISKDNFEKKVLGQSLGENSNRNLIEIMEEKKPSI